MKLKKWLSAIFAVVMVMSLLPAAALAAEGENTDDSTTQVEEAADITKVQAPTAPKTDPQEPAAQDNGIMLLDESDSNDDTASSQPTTLEAAPDTLEAVLQTANDGDTINLAAGTYNLNSYNINVAVSLQGAGMDQTIINGSIYYSLNNATTEDIRVSGMTIQSWAGNTARNQALCWSNGSGMLTNSTITVENCKIVDFLYGIGVNSNTSDCTLDVKNCYV